MSGGNQPRVRSYGHVKCKEQDNGLLNKLKARYFSEWFDDWYHNNRNPSRRKPELSPDPLITWIEEICPDHYVSEFDETTILLRTIRGGIYMSLKTPPWMAMLKHYGKRIEGKLDKLISLYKEVLPNLCELEKKLEEIIS
jgi:hypothetical protein